MGATVSSLELFVKTRRIARVDLIKIDVDGNELDVLAGATEVIELFRPKIIVEIADDPEDSSNNKVFQVMDFLTSRGYRFRSLKANSSFFESNEAVLAACPKGGGDNFLAEFSPERDQVMPAGAVGQEQRMALGSNPVRS
jgi:hypothetical protein